MQISDAATDKISNLLKTQGILSEGRYNLVAAQFAKNKERIIPELINKKFITEDDVAKVVSRSLGAKRIELQRKDINLNAFKLVPEDIIKEEKIIPFAVVGPVINVAIADPTKVILMAKIKASSQKSVAFFIAQFSEIEEILKSNIFEEAKAKPATPGAKASPGGVPQGIDPRLMGSLQKKRTEAITGTNIVAFVDQIFQDSLADGTSDIHIETFRDSAQVRFRTDGIMKVQEELSSQIRKNYGSVVTRMKIMAGCDISEQRLPQDGAITVKDQSQGGKDTDVRFNVVPTKYGERICMRLLKSSNIMALDSIGIPEVDLKKFIKGIESPQGMVLVTGPTGSGKTTTLYAGIQHINSPETNIMTAEDPVEYTMAGIGQVQANETIGLSFATILRAFLRQDPEVILVGEIRDKETVDIAIKAALTGHLVLSTLHTQDALATIVRMTNMGVPPFMISGALNMIVAQRLARRTCKACIVDDPAITPEMLKDVGYSVSEIPSIKCKKGKGCDKCEGSGYKGRQGIYEFLEITNKVGQGIIDGLRTHELLEVAKKDGFVTMEQRARDLVKDGVLSYVEFLRVISISH
tara:strand:- start:1483 stop:3225 length:1743 start_codon:yes stop_codon:yes gene_type:complete